jgi:hypothetical protein
MELEWGSASVDRYGSRGRWRASGGGIHSADVACASECRWAVLDRRWDAHLSRDVGHHGVEDAGADESRCS